MEEIKALLQQAAAKGLPLIVANPDVLTVSGNTLVPMPGTFARWYKEMDGEVWLLCLTPNDTAELGAVQYWSPLWHAVSIAKQRRHLHTSQKSWLQLMQVELLLL